MIKFKVLFVLLAIAVAAPVFAQKAGECTPPEKIALKKGMKVVAEWQGNNWWVGTVDSVKGGKVDVTYTDKTKGAGKEAIAHPDLLYKKSKPCFKVGDTVISAWRNDSWWKATITNITDNLADVTYADGEKGKHSVNDMVPYR